MYKKLVNNRLSYTTLHFNYDVKLIEDGKFIQKNLNGLETVGT